jgi:PAS domain S-box-containing protein
MGARKDAAPTGKPDAEERRARTLGGEPADRRAHGDRLRFETLLTDLSARFINLPADRVDGAIEDAQRRVCECLGLDLSAVWQRVPETPDVFLLTHLHRPPGGPPAPERMEASKYHPWSLRQVMAGKTVAIASTEDVPAEAARDQEVWRHYGVKTTLQIPLASGGGEPFGAVSFNDLKGEREWLEPLVRRLELVAQIFANAIARKRAEEVLLNSEQRISLATAAADAGLWELSADRTRFWVSPKIRELLGIPPGGELDVEAFIDLVHPEDRGAVRETIEAALRSQEMTVAEYRIVRPDGAVRWMQSRGRMCVRAAGEGARLMGISSDITARKGLELQLRQSLEENQRLQSRLQNENLYLRTRVLDEFDHGMIVGESEPMLAMLAKARRVAATDSAVLIAGETGTGKELLAQFIHDQSPRKAKTMVKVNCAALPPPLIESELFGRERGAYTGAMTQQAGRFEIADGSTIFLDEIGDLPLDLQSKLLRVLQDGEFQRLGSNRTHRADARVIAATNRDLTGMVAAGTFREDLFHRLDIFPIEVPPLRERTSDIPLLVWKFVQAFNTKMGRSVDSIPRATMEQLKNYPWPGNVRELRNLIERAMIVSDGPSLKIELPQSCAVPRAADATLEEIERRHILAVLERSLWRIRGKGGAAEILGLPPTTLHSRMRKLGLTRPRS